MRKKQGNLRIHLIRFIGTISSSNNNSVHSLCCGVTIIIRVGSAIGKLLGQRKKNQAVGNACKKDQGN
jgi:hypothetical protein